jgi:hypothetical protein
MNPAADAHAVSAADIEGRWEIIASMAWRGLTGIATAGLFRMEVHLRGKRGGIGMASLTFSPNRIPSASEIVAV